MPKLQMLVSIAGPTGDYQPGEIWNNSDAADCARLVAAGFAIEVIEDHDLPKVENPEAKASAKRSKR